MEIILASYNEGKIKEFRNILLAYDIRLKSLKDINYHDEIIEDGNSFFENAYIKAKTITDATKEIAVADDSGICVGALNNDPGIYSARYSKEKTDQKNNELLLKNMKDIHDRRAYYECSIVVCFPNGSYKHYEAKCFGVIATHSNGENGFGYDSLFIPDGFGLTFGLIDEQIKHTISHRGKAIKLMVEDIKNWETY